MCLGFNVFQLHPSPHDRHHEVWTYRPTGLLRQGGSTYRTWDQTMSENKIWCDMICRWLYMYIFTYYVHMHEYVYIYTYIWYMHIWSYTHICIYIYIYTYLDKIESGSWFRNHGNNQSSLISRWGPNTRSGCPAEQGASLINAISWDRTTSQTW